MNRAWRYGGRVLAAVLAAATMVSSVPTAVLTTYAVEDTAEAAALTSAPVADGTEGTAEVAPESTEEDANPATETAEQPSEDVVEPAGESAAQPSEGTEPTENSAGETTEQPSEGTTEPAEPAEGSAETSTEPAGENTDPAAGADADAAEGVTEDAITDAADAATTEPAEAADAETTEAAAEDTAYDVFPGMGASYQLTAAQVADKQELAENLAAYLPDDLDEELYIGEEDVYVPGEVVYVTESEEEAQAVAAAYGATLDSYAYNVAIISLADDVTVARAIAAAADEDMDLPAVWPNYYYHLDDVDLNDIDAEDALTEAAVTDAVYDDPFLDEDSIRYQWMHEYVGSTYAWTARYKGQGIKVAVIDSGIRETHEDLAANALDGKMFADGAEGTAHSGDTQGHGTHVAGIIAAVADNGKGGAGIAPEAQVAGYCVAPSGTADDADMMRAIYAAIDAGDIDIINMSLGGAEYNALLADACLAAYQAGIAVFASAGNECVNTYHYPSSYDGVISIGAIDRTGGKASFSNYGSTVDLTFPGVSIYSTYKSSDSSYTSMSGTSMSCPVASGVAAVILSARSDIRDKSGKARVDALFNAMKKGAVKSSSSGMGAGTTYLPTTLGLSTVTSAPTAPTITIKEAYDSTRKAYLYEQVTAAISVTSQDDLAIYYSTDGKTPTYRNGTVTNGELLTDEPTDKTLYTGEVTLGGARKVTLKAITLNTITGKTSKVVTQTITLMPIPTAVEITQANGTDTVTAGSSLTLNATVTPSYAISTKVAWSVDEAGKAVGIKVSNGKVTAPAGANGTYEITATAVGTDGKTYDGVSDTYSVTVVGKTNVKVKTFKLTSTKAAIDLTNTTTVDLSEQTAITMSDPEVAYTGGITWTSANRKVATVDSDGVVTAVGKGSAVITATLNDGSGKKATCTVTVTSLVTGITVSGYDQVAAGKSITLQAEVTPADANNKKVKWVAEGNDLVTVQNGRLTAGKNATGTCTVYAYATDGSGVASEGYVVNILAGAITKITLSDKSMTLFRVDPYGEDWNIATLEATVAGTNADESAVLFSSSAPNVVAVEQDGTTATLTPKAVGKATITCTATDGSGKKATCTVNVNIPMSSLKIRPADGYNSGVVPGKSVQLTTWYGSRYGTPTNKKVVWYSETPDLATVSQSGKVTVKKTAATGDYAVIVAEAADGSGVAGYYMVDVLQPMKRIGVTQPYSNALVVREYDADGEVYDLDYLDVKVSGGTKAGCGVAKDTNSSSKTYGQYYLTPTTAKVTYPSTSALPSRVTQKWLNKYAQKVTVTIMLKDGSGLKKSVTVYVARNKSDKIKIYMR